MKTLSYLFQMIIHPRRTSQALLKEKSLIPAFWVVFGFGAIFAISFLISHFKGDYPPPAEELELWIEAWGEFTMLPFIKIPAEQYRLLQAIFIVPLTLAIWILMAGSARLLSILFGGKTSFDQYASLFGFSFFVFWILATIIDAVLSGVFGEVVLSALRLEYGTTGRNLIVYFYPIMYTILFGLGGVYNAIVTIEAEHFSAWKAALIGMVTFIYADILIACLIR